MACIIRSYTNKQRYLMNKRRAIKSGTFENCWISGKYWVLMEIKI